VQPVAEVLVALQRQLRRLLLGHHQLLQVVLQDDHPDGRGGGGRGVTFTTLSSYSGHMECREIILIVVCRSFFMNAVKLMKE